MPVRRKRKKSLAARVYLEFKVAEDYPDQAPAWKKAKNIDLLWLVIPIAGFLMFIAATEARS